MLSHTAVWRQKFFWGRIAFNLYRAVKTRLAVGPRLLHKPVQQKRKRKDLPLALFFFLFPFALGSWGKQGKYLHL